MADPIYAIFFWQLVNKTAGCFNNFVFILVRKTRFKKVCEKMENNSTLEKVLLGGKRNAELLRLVEAIYDSKLAFLRRIRKKNLVILKSLQKKSGSLFVWVASYQLKVFGKLYICSLNVLKTNGVFFSTKKCALYFKKCNFVFVS